MHPLSSTGDTKHISGVGVKEFAFDNTLQLTGFYTRKSDIVTTFA
jgi:hypothetical protein